MRARGLSDKGAELLAQFPGPVTLYATTSWLIFFVVVGLAFSGLGAAVTIGVVGAIADLDPIQIPVLIALGLFLLGLGAYSLIALPIAFFRRQIKLSLDHEGFEVRIMPYLQNDLWSTAADFRPRVFFVRLVTYRDATLAGNFIGKINRSSLVGRRGFSNIFGIRTDELADVMNVWRERALSRQHPDA